MGTALKQAVWPLELVQDTYLTQARGGLGGLPEDGW